MNRCKAAAIPFPGFAILSRRDSGSCPRVGHPVIPWTLCSRRDWRKSWTNLTEWFDWILIDSPPVAPLADASVWMRLADGILMVVREGKTQKRQLRRGLQKLDQSKMLGVVLNGSNNVDHDNYYQRYGPLPVK